MANDHELRAELNDELHVRAGMAVTAPATIIHLTFTLAPGDLNPLLAVTELCCEEAGLALPSPQALHFATPYRGGSMRFERHGEFYRISFVMAGGLSETAEILPAGWIARLPGKRLVAIRTSLVQQKRGISAETIAQGMFGHEETAASAIGHGTASLWTDFRIGADGFTKILVENISMSPVRMGRALRRIHEIETYRMMALLALPVARKLLPEISRLEENLDRTVDAMTQGKGIYNDAALLEQLSATSGRIESIASRSTYRFSASRAYATLVAKRIAELNEQRIDSHQRIGIFLDRRFSPAMATCQAVSDRIASLAQRCERAGNLLRTRVDIAVEGQNQQLLSAMNERSHQQLKLQETVEGLSIVAISYYASALVFKMFEGPLHAFDPATASLVQMAIIPAIIIGVWLVLRQIKRRIVNRENG